jgi:hypothetical protein
LAKASTPTSFGYLSPDSVESNGVKEEWTDAYWDQVNSQRTRLAGVLCRDCQIPHFLRDKKYFGLRTNQPRRLSSDQNMAPRSASGPAASR